MDLNLAKIELAKRILDIQDPEIIRQFEEILDAAAQAVTPPLSEAQKQEIELGLAQLDRGERISWEEFNKQVS
jgi:hypothetical protein